MGRIQILLGKMRQLTGEESSPTESAAHRLAAVVVLCPCILIRLRARRVLLARSAPHRQPGVFHTRSL